MTTQEKSRTILFIEKLRLIESEVFRLSSRYGVRTIDELDHLIETGNLSEKEVGDDIFLFDYLLEQKDSLEKELKKLEISKSEVWKNFQDLLGLPKLSLRT